MLPVSLLAHITDASAVFGVNKFSNSFKSRSPWFETFKYLMVAPCEDKKSQVCMIAGCSTGVVTISVLPFCDHKADHKAVLSDSVAHEVKIISSGCSAPRKSATCSRAFAIAFSTGTP